MRSKGQTYAHKRNTFEPRIAAPSYKRAWMPAIASSALMMP